MPVDISTGATVTFGTSGFSANVNSISWSSVERASVETTHLGTTTAHTFTPGDLFNPGELSLEIQFDPDDYPPIDAAAETITVTFPLSSGGSSAATWAASGFATGFEFGLQTEELMTGSLTVKLSGDITDTDES